MSHHLAISATPDSTSIAKEETLLDRIVRRIRRRFQVWRTCEALDALPDEILRDIRVPRCAIRSIAEQLH